MNDSNEALGRIAIAELGARRLKKRAEERARWWRFAGTSSRILVAFGAAVYFQVTHLQISGTQVCGFFLIYLAASAWPEHQTRESLRSLQAELNRLKDEIQEKRPSQIITAQRASRVAE